MCLRFLNKDAARVKDIGSNLRRCGATEGLLAPSLRYDLMKLPNHHNHTGNHNFSYCAEPDLYLEWYEEHQELWSQVAITDHAFAIAFPKDIAWGFRWHTDPSYFEEYREYRLDKMKQYLDMLSRLDRRKFIPGIELEVTSRGELTVDEEYIPHFEIILGAVHYLPGEDEEEIIASFTEQVTALMEHPIDILAHPFRILERKISDIPPWLIDFVVTRATEANVALELNSHKISPYDETLVARTLKQGGKVAIGTDTHARYEFLDASYHLDLCRKLGIGPQDIFIK
jgi:histidinol phosphatase-like PHP family hydrolase